MCCPAVGKEGHNKNTDILLTGFSLRSTTGAGDFFAEKGRTRPEKGS